MLVECTMKELPKTMDSNNSHRIYCGMCALGIYRQCNSLTLFEGVRTVMLLQVGVQLECN